MKITKWISALAAASLLAAPVAAQPMRTAAPLDQAESLKGGLGFAWIMAAIMVVGAILVIADDDGGDQPRSP